MPHRLRLLLILGLLTSIGPLSIDMYLPTFPLIAQDLGTSIGQVGLSLSSFFVGISLGQLLYGPLLERFGRKKPVYFGLSLCVLASLGCALAPTVEWLIALRLLQALGGCVGLVAGRAMVRDLFPVNESAKVFSLLLLVVSISPILAPSLGSFLTAHFGWHSIFLALGFIALLLVAGTRFFVPISRPPNPDVSLRPAAILQQFKLVMRHPQFLTFALVGAFSAAGLYGYLAGAPHLIIDMYGLSQHQFGLVFALVAAGLITASQINSRLLRRWSSEKIIPVASAFQLGFGLLLVAALLSGQAPIQLVVVLLFAFLSCQGFIFPNATALALAPMGHAAGNASGLIGAVQMTIGALASAAVSLLAKSSGWPMAAVMSACAGLALSAFLIGRRFMEKSETAAEGEMVEALEL